MKEVGEGKAKCCIDQEMGESVICHTSAALRMGVIRLGMDAPVEYDTLGSLVVVSRAEEGEEGKILAHPNRLLQSDPISRTVHTYTFILHTDPKFSQIYCEEFYFSGIIR